MITSTSLTIIDLLIKVGADVQYSDPYLPEAPKTRKYNFELKSIKISKETIKGFDPKSGKYCSQSSSDELKPINATLFRNAILIGEKVPDWFLQRPIQEMLLSELRAGRKIFHG